MAFPSTGYPPTPPKDARPDPLQALPSLGGAAPAVLPRTGQVDGGDPTRHHRQPDRLAGRGLPTGERVAGSGGHGWRTTLRLHLEQRDHRALEQRTRRRQLHGDRGGREPGPGTADLHRGQRLVVAVQQLELSGTGWTCQLSGFVLGRVPGDRGLLSRDAPLYLQRTDRRSRRLRSPCFHGPGPLRW